MRKVILGFAVVALTASSAMALLTTGDVPSKAKGLKGEFVTGYEPCSTPNQSSFPPIVLPGCTPVRSDSVCEFGSKGAGKFGATVSKTDVKLSASFSGLSCTAGTILTVGTTTNVTTEDCTAGDCTLIVPANFPIGTCTVDTKGGCKISGTVEGFLGNTTVFKDGKIVNIEIQAINVLRGANRPFAAGVRIGPK